MRGIRVGTVFGIPIQLHWTFLLILPVFAIIIGWDIGLLAELLNDILGSDIEPAALEGTYRPWMLGFIAAVGLFIGVLLHEFGHSLVAINTGYEIDSITLWLLGGLASLAEMPEAWWDEFRIAVAGPIVSIAVGVVCYLGFLFTPVELDAARFVLGYLAVLNVFLAVFNMLPAFPMDGGRVLRALLARRQPHAQATQKAAEVGKTFAILMGILGLLAFNIILILLAFFIYIAATAEAQQTMIKAVFQDVRVEDIMTTRSQLRVVTPETTVAELMERMLDERHTGYPVVDGAELVGLVTLDDAREIDRALHRETTMVDIMSSDVVTVTPKTDAMEALQTIQRHKIGRLPVVDERGALCGLVTRTDLMRAFDIIQATGAPRLIGGREEFAEGGFFTKQPR